MAFARIDIDALLATTGRMCAICNRLHGVQVHHIIPSSQGGSDDITNAIPLCPNCHDEVHARYAPGRTTRVYTEHELRRHLERTVALAGKQVRLTVGDSNWEHDVELISFYAGCLDRPAFRTRFHQELSFADFDQALEDVVLAINTGLQRTRDGTVIERSSGKRALINPTWRINMDKVVTLVTRSRHLLRNALGLDQMFMHLGDGRHPYDQHGVRLRSDTHLAHAMDELRQQAIDVANEVLAEAHLPLLKEIGNWT